MIDSVNPNCWAATVGYLGVTSADVVASQEAKRLAHQTKAAEDDAPRIGWKAIVAAAQCTWAGRASGGAAVATRRHIGMAVPRGVAVAQEFASRISMAWVGGMVAGGFVMFSVYLYPSEGMTPRNQAVLDEVARIAALLRCPWIMAADWQMTPEEVASAGWPALVGATLVALGAITCNSSTIDDFAVHDSLMPLVCGVAVVDDAGFHPHSPVRLFVRVGEKVPPVRRMAPPRGFIAEVPPGCLPHASTVPLQRTGGRGPLEYVPTPSDPDDGDSHLEDEFNLWPDTAEGELADLFSLEGKERQAHVGRKDGPKFIQGGADKGTGDAHVVRATALSRAWRCVAQWSAALAAAVRAHDASDATKVAVSATARRAACRLRNMADRTVPFSSWTTDARRDDLHERVEAQQTVAPQMMAAAALAAAQRPADLDDIVTTARAAAERHERGYVACKLREWKRWLRGPAGGLGRQHRFLKRVGGWLPSSLAARPPEHDPDADDPRLWMKIVKPGSEEAMPVAGQALVEAEARQWAEQWGVGCKLPRPAWPTCIDDMPARPTPHQLRQTFRTFPAATGLAWDGIHQRALARLSDQRLAELVAIITRCERAGRWPASLGTVSIVLLPKPGWPQADRPISVAHPGVDAPEEARGREVAGAQRQGVLLCRAWEGR